MLCGFFSRVRGGLGSLLVLSPLFEDVCTSPVKVPFVPLFILMKQYIHVMTILAEHLRNV